MPEAALDPVTGRLYVVFEDAGAAGGRYDAIALVASDDGGRHWTYRTAVPSPPGTPAVTPSLAVSSDGRIGITCEFCSRVYDLDPAEVEAEVARPEAR